MKIKLETIVEIPDDMIAEFPMGKEEQAKQIIRDGITDYVRLKHTAKCLEYALSDKKAEAHREKLWSDLCEKLNWKMSVLKR